MEVAVGSDSTAAKYQKLASEYSKMRAQLGVLKKAVLDEQANVLELKGSLKERDHVIRKTEQETESLTFRNQQLTRRVAVLQEELDERLHKPRGKNKNKSTGDSPTTPPQFTNHILLEELQQKISENERLHQQIYDSDGEHAQIVLELQKRLEELERKSAGHDRDVSDMNHSNRALIDRLQQDRARLEVNLQTALRDLKEMNFKADLCRDQLNSCRQDLGSQLRRTTDIIKSRLPFIDTNDPELNRLNVPSCSRRSHEQSRHLVEQASALVTEIATGLSNFHTYCQQRAPLKLAEDGSTDVGPVQLQLIRHLHENAPYIRQMEQSFRELRDDTRDGDSLGCFEMAAGFEGFVDKLDCYVAYLRKLAPYQILGLEEESRSAPCPSGLAAKNRDLVDGWLQLVGAFEKVRTYSRLLTTGLSVKARCKALKSISVGIGDIHGVLKEMGSQYNGKLAIERSLPTVTERLRTTDECLLTSLVSLVANFGKLSSLLVDKLDAIFVDQGLVCNSTEADAVDGKANRFSPRVVATYKRRAVDYLAIINEGSQAPSVPYAEALRNRRVLQSSTESRESLASQLSNCQEKISALEQSREHWMLEYQLLHMKQEKMQTNLQESEGTDNAAATKIPNFKAASNVVPKSTSFSSLVGRVDVEPVVSDAGGSPVSGEVKDLRSYFVDRVNSLIVQRQMVDSKTVAFHAELCAVRKRLLIAESAKRALQEQLHSNEESVISLKEELQTTTNNYKAQLSTMSEHLANMNEKLTSQKDEIDELKFSLSNVGNRKNKGK